MPVAIRPKPGPRERKFEPGKGADAGADFYLGIGKYAHYLGSIEHDGDPGWLDDEYDLFGFGLNIPIPPPVALGERPVRDKPFREEQWKARVKHVLDKERGVRAWPWPWRDSTGTRYSYSFNDGTIRASDRGRQLMLVYPNLAQSPAIFPPMTDAARIESEIAHV